MKVIFISFLSLHFLLQVICAQPDIGLAKKYAQKYPKEDAIITSAVKIVEFSYDKGIGKVVVEEELSYRLLALKPHCNISIGAFYDDNIDILVFKSENIKITDKTCGNYQPEGVFHSDFQLCVYSFPFMTIGEENTIKIKRKHYDIHYYSKTSFTDQRFPIVKSSISYKIPEGLSIDFKEYNTDNVNLKKEIYKSEKNLTNITYSCEDICKNLDESDIPPSSWYIPHILVIPKTYINKGINVRLFNNLDDLYAWCKNKADQTNNNMEKITPVVNQLLQGKNDAVDKIKTIFYWVQDNIKYIAFEEGLAGYIPDNAQSVFENKYGDCKGMANLLKCMLGAAGFDARLTWLGTNHLPYNYTIPTLVSSNHVICTLFNGNNRYYLDATDKYNAIGSYSEAICGRQVLIENGTEFILDSIPAPAETENQLISYSEYEVSDKLLVGNVRICYHGDWRSNILSSLLSNRTDEKSRILEAIVSRGLPKVNASSITSSDLNNRDTTLVLNAAFNINGQVMPFDNELYINVDPFDDLVRFNLKEDRKIPFFFPQREKRKTITKLHFPAGYKLKNLPPDFSFTNSYLSFKISYKEEGSLLYYTKECTLQSNYIPQSDLPVWVNDLKKIKKAASQPVILTKI